MDNDKSLKIDEIKVAGGGVIGMCACPGRNQPRKEGVQRWQRSLADDLRAIKIWKANYMLTLVEKFEFDELGVPDFEAQITEANIPWLYLPTKNLSAPDFSSGSYSKPIDVFLDEELRAGRRVLIHCAAGKGRTGTLASALLIRQGRTASAAVKEVRNARPGAIESAIQLEFLLAYEPKASATSELPPEIQTLT